jgi:hypothetical protein
MEGQMDTKLQSPQFLSYAQYVLTISLLWHVDGVGLFCSPAVIAGEGDNRERAGLGTGA